MLKRLCLLSVLPLLLMAVIPMIADDAHATPNRTMHSYEITRVICPDGGVGYSWTKYYTWEFSNFHPLPVWECWEEVEDGTGFRYEVCEKVHVSHGMEDEYLYNYDDKHVSRYHWSCR